MIELILAKDNTFWLSAHISKKKKGQSIKLARNIGAAYILLQNEVRQIKYTAV